MKTILVIDDDPYILDAIMFTLEDEGYTVVTSQHGKDAEKLMKKNGTLPDLVIMDVLLSGKDGRVICRKLKNSPVTGHIPVIMISAKPDTDKSIHEAGADEFLAKPFEIDDLLSLVSKHLSV